MSIEQSKQSQSLKNRLKDGFRRVNGNSRNKNRLDAKLIILATTALLGLALYLLVIGTVAYFTFTYIVSGVDLGSPSALFTNIVKYILPVISGIALLALLIRPFYSLKPESLTAEQNFEITGLNDVCSHLCKGLDVHGDVDIRLTIKPIVELEPIGLSKFHQKSYQLNISVLSIEGLSVNHLCALMAHEIALLSSRPIYAIYLALTALERWYQETISNQDGWDEFFEQMDTQNSSMGSSVIAILGRSGIWVNNQILNFMYKLSMPPMQRALLHIQKKTDARTMVLVGSSDFLQAVNKMNRQTQQLRKVEKWLPDTKSLSNNLVSVVLNTELSDRDDELEDDGQFNWGTMPCINTRKSSAVRFNSQSKITLPIPARLLVDDFDTVMKSLTVDYYRKLRLSFSPSNLKVQKNNHKQEAIELHLARKNDEFTASTFTADYIWDVQEVSDLVNVSEQENYNKAQDCINLYRRFLPDIQSAIFNVNQCAESQLKNVILEKMLSNGFATESMLAHQIKQDALLQDKYQDSTKIVNAYCKINGHRVVRSILLLDDNKQLAAGKYSLQLLRVLKSIEPLVKKTKSSYDLISALHERAIKHAEVGYQAEMEQLATKVYEGNLKIKPVLSKFPGVLKGVNSTPDYLNELIKDASPITSDPIGTPLFEFEAMYAFYQDLNKIISGRLANFAIASEKKKGIEPVRLGIDSNYKKAA